MKHKQLVTEVAQYLAKIRTETREAESNTELANRIINHVLGTTENFQPHCFNGRLDNPADTSRSGFTWTKEELAELTNEVEAGMDVRCIAARHQRSIGAIMSRAEKLTIAFNILGKFYKLVPYDIYKPASPTPEENHF